MNLINLERWNMKDPILLHFFFPYFLHLYHLTYNDQIQHGNTSEGGAFLRG